VLPVTGGTAGLADFGTRLRATFNNVPTGVHIFVSVANVLNSAVPAPVPAIIGGSAANTTTTGYALLISSETVGDGNGTTGFLPSVTATDNATGGLVGIAEVPVSATGTAEAVWEVVNTSPTSLDTLKFAVFTTFAGNTVPATTGATVDLSFAPAPPAISLTTGTQASSSLPIPRFADLSKANTVLNVNVCRTVLLYPFVTNQAGFDTGIAIANTSTDPFSTGPQSGPCTLNWFSGTTSPVATPFPGLTANPTLAIASGTVSTGLASILVPGFQGYMIAVCNFQFAHGFAFISDLGAQKLAMGYLALVIPDPSTSGNARNPDPLSTAAAGSGENTAH
jgi:hypothetical protein